MDFLRGQYVIYGSVRIIWTGDEVRGRYNPNRSIYKILTGKKSLIFILHDFQYYYLNIMKFWNFMKTEISEIFGKFWNLMKVWKSFEILKKNYFFFFKFWTFMKFLNTDKLTNFLFICWGTGPSAMLFTTGGV